MKTGKRYILPKDKVLEYFGALPTVKTELLIIRQKGHPLGDWKVSKPSRRHQYILEIF
jgi:hypothetical protein